jgi:hypothetical protein
MNYRTARERKVSLRWVDASGKSRARLIWIRDIPAFVARNQPAGKHSFEWRDAGGNRPWKKV